MALWLVSSSLEQVFGQLLAAWVITLTTPAGAVVISMSSGAEGLPLLQPGYLQQAHSRHGTHNHLRGQTCQTCTMPQKQQQSIEPPQPQQQQADPGAEAIDTIWKACAYGDLDKLHAFIKDNPAQASLLAT